jgi:alkylhydroperoxidase family enzyme
VTSRYALHVERLRASLREPPRGLRAYAAKVRDDPHAVTDADIAALRAAGFSEDEIFEASVAAAVAAGLERLDLALGVVG